MLGYLRVVTGVAFLVCLGLMGGALWNDHVERKRMMEIGRMYFQERNTPDLHARVVHLRDELLAHFIVKPQNDQVLKDWLAHRPFLRQPAMETVAGKPALCGELSRLVIKVLRAEGVQARRVYLYKNWATNHVLFEYQDPHTLRWHLMDSYASTDYLHDLLNAQTLSPIELLQRGDPTRLVYDKFGYLPKQLFFRYGEPFARGISYKISWWFEEIYLLKAVEWAVLALLAVAAWLVMRWRTALSFKESGA